MKKFVLVLIVCTLLCASLCLLLVGCDSSDAEAKAPNSGETKIEFVRSVYDSYYYPKLTNIYTFRVWYPIAWYAKDYGKPVIRYRLSENDEWEYASYFAEFLREEYADTKIDMDPIAPDTWMYFDIELSSAPTVIYIEVVIYQYPSPIETPVKVTIAKSKIDLKGTFKDHRIYPYPSID